MTPMDMRMASYSLLAYALGLLGFMLIKILAPGFFARQDMVTPVKVGIIAMTSNMFLNLMLVFPLFYMFGMGHVGLALATSLSAFLNAGLLFYFLIKKKYYTPSDGWFRFFMQVTLALVSMIAMVIIASEHVGIFHRDFWLSTTAWNRGSRILLISLLGFFAYSVSLYCFGFRKIDLSAPHKRVSSR
jgi:putative peptidoglycan lipid II flippase